MWLCEIWNTKEIFKKGILRDYAVCNCVLAEASVYEIRVNAWLINGQGGWRPKTGLTAGDDVRLLSGSEQCSTTAIIWTKCSLCLTAKIVWILVVCLDSIIFVHVL